MENSQTDQLISLWGIRRGRTLDLRNTSSIDSHKRASQNQNQDPSDIYFQLTKHYQGDNDTDVFSATWNSVMITVSAPPHIIVGCREHSEP